MANYIQNVQDEQQKFGPISTPDFSSRKRRGGFQANSAGRKGYSETMSRFTDSVKYNRPGERKYRYPRPTHFKLPKYDGLAEFKMAPSVVAEYKPRPFMGSCCVKCFPQSRANVPDISVKTLSIFNVLHIPCFQMEPFRIDLSKFQNALKVKQKPTYPDVSADVLKSESIRCVIQTNEELEEGNNSSDDVKTKQYLRAKAILESMKSSLSAICLRLSSFLFHYILHRVFDGILIHKGQIEILKAVGQDTIPIIYLPVHRSYFDYVLVSYVLYMNSMRVPLIAAEENFHIPFINYLLKLLGAFFVRSQLDSNSIQKDHLYRAVLHSYLTECLKVGHSLEFFIEGSPSRTGKPKMPENLLSATMDAVLIGSIEDVLISPVSISYEKIVEGNFVFEQLGHPKEKKSFFSVVCTIWKLMHLQFGNVRLNFGQPISIKEFLQSHKEIISPKLTTMETPPPSPTSDGFGSCEYFTKSCLRSAIKELSHHIMYDVTFSTSLMSTQLLAFLLVTQYRKGATQQQLQNSMDWLRGELLNKKCDAGFTGESLPVIKRAVDFLGKDLITSETIEMEWTSSDLENNNVKVIVYKPIVKLPHVLELQYYANSVVPVFVLDSMLVNAVYALVDVDICHFRHCDSKLYVVRDKLIDKAMELNDMFQFEFIAVPPCADIALSFSCILDELIEKECLHVAGVRTFSGRSSQIVGKSSALSFETSDEDDDEFISFRTQQLKIDLKEESINHLEFLRNILSSYIESYWFAACALLKLVDEVKEETVFIQEMQLTAQEKLYKGLLAYEESFSAETFKNSLKLFEYWHVIEYYMQEGVKVLYLEDSFNSVERINDIIARVEEFRK